MKLTTFKPQKLESMPPDGVVCSEWPVGPRTVRVVQDVTPTRGVGPLRYDWLPDMPHRLSKREWSQYRAGRDAHHQRIANIIGSGVICAEL